MQLDNKVREFVHNYVDFIIYTADHIDKFEYDIIDEYDGTVETMEAPVNYKIKRDEKRIFFISVNTKSIEQHKRHRQLWFVAESIHNNS